MLTASTVAACACGKELMRDQVLRGAQADEVGWWELSVSAPVHTAVHSNAEELCEEGWAESEGLKLAKLVPNGTIALMQPKTQAHV